MTNIKAAQSFSTASEGAAHISGRAACIVIDMQNYFLESIDESEALVAGVNDFLQKLPETTDIVYVSSVLNQDFLDDDYAQQNQLGVLRLAHGQSFTKNSSSAFEMDKYGVYGDLNGFLGHHGISHLYMIGINKSICVAQTALDAVALGYEVEILHDLTADAANVLKSSDIEPMTQDLAQQHGIGWQSSQDVLDRLKSAVPTRAAAGPESALAPK